MMTALAPQQFFMLQRTKFIPCHKFQSSISINVPWVRGLHLELLKKHLPLLSLGCFLYVAQSLLVLLLL